MEPSEATAYRAQLFEIASRLEPFASAVSVRGTGAAQFVFAESALGAVELSTEQNGVFVELWSPGAGNPARHETHETFESAVASAVSWLREGS